MIVVILASDGEVGCTITLEAWKGTGTPASSYAMTETASGVYFISTRNSPTSPVISADWTGILFDGGSGTRLLVSSGGWFGIGSSGTDANTQDVSLSRASAGVWQLGSGATPNAAGSLNLANLTASGAVTVGSTSIGYLGEFTDPLNGSVKALRIGTKTASKRIFIGNPSNPSYAVNFSGCATFEGLPNLGNVGTGNLTSNGWIDGKHRPYTFAGLPLASAAQDKTFVCTDSTLAMTSANYGSTPAGGGANRVRLFSNGTVYLLA